LQFPALNRNDVAYVFSPELDECLLKAFTLRVTEAGIAFDSPPALRTIPGGQSSGAA
jgi:predicted type IV restriction endonuclease